MKNDRWAYAIPFVSMMYLLQRYGTLERAPPFCHPPVVRQLQLQPSPLMQPVRLEVWDGPGAVISHQVCVKNVRFGSLQGKWTFLVIDDNPPCSVVAGLDFSRAWHLTLNPLNDHLIPVSPSNPCISPKGTTVVRGAPLEEPENRHQESLGLSTLTCRVEGDVMEGDEVMVYTVHMPRAPESEWMQCNGQEEDPLLLQRQRHSVTGHSEEEGELRKEFLASLPSEVATLTERFPRLFMPPESVPPERAVKHHIQLKPNVLPIRRSPYLVGGEKLVAMKEQVRQLAEQGWIERTVSLWGAPVLFVPKKEKVFRMCGDFRDLNAVTVNDSFPLPRVELMLHRAGDAKVFSKLDLASGFHQIALTAESKPLTAFCLPEPVEGNSVWQWTVMPFGLKNAPPTFQRAMTFALQGCEAFAIVYIDDILIFSETKQDYLNHLHRVFECLEREAYHVRLTKCVFQRDEVEFLGHLMSFRGLRASPTKIATLSAWNPPLHKPRQVKQFLGLVMWYKAFIPHLATIAAPLFPSLLLPSVLSGPSPPPKRSRPCSIL